MSLQCGKCHGPLFDVGDDQLACSACEHPTYGGMVDLVDRGDGEARCTRVTCGWEGPAPGSTHCPRCEPKLAEVRYKTKRPPPPPRKRRRR